MTITSKSLQAEMSLEGAEPELFEMYHENSKLGRLDFPLPTEVVVAVMGRMAESLKYEQTNLMPLPKPEEMERLSMPLEDAITKRTSAREFSAEPVPISYLASILHHAYGINRDNKETGFNRAFRNAPSGGALFPLEIYFTAANVKGLAPGLYHYSPEANEVKLIGGDEKIKPLASALMQLDISTTAAFTVFITAIFERTVFKYRDRGYRFILLEAGHVAQNLNLAGEALGVGTVNVGGYIDREVDEHLGLDGVAQSTVYVICGGMKKNNGQNAPQAL